MRWQSITIGQLTYAINLILAFSVATLGFQVTLLLNERFMPISWQKGVFSLSLILLSSSVALGVWVVINRLRDFRVTTKAARKREEGVCEEKIEPYRTLYRNLGKKTWCLFWWQVGTFVFGVLCTVLSVLASSIHKLI
jgi:hypothetical protein